MQLSRVTEESRFCPTSPPLSLIRIFVLEIEHGFDGKGWALQARHPFSPLIFFNHGNQWSPSLH
jgi:hypothetical protein